MIDNTYHVNVNQEDLLIGCSIILLFFHGVAIDRLDLN